MAGQTYVPIATQTLGSATNSITFSSIPSTYTDLVVVINTLTTTDTPDISIRLNSDSGTNYSRTRVYGTGSGVGSARSTNESTGYLIPQYQESNTNVLITAHIMNYSNTTTYKTIVNRFGGAQLTSSGATGANVILWRSTAAVSTVTILSATSANYATGSTFTLYGIQAA